MREYAIDFTMNRGHEMVLSDPERLTRDRLDELELRMLQAEKVPGLLELEWLELDGAISFHYKLDGKRMLAHRLQLHPLSMADYCSLLLGVLETLDNCRLYMLRPEAIVLHENYIFAGDSWQELGLVYVPVQDSSSLGQQSSHEGLLGLAVRWATHIQHVDGTALQHILQQLDPGSGSLSELRLLLLDLVSSPYGMTEGNIAHPQTAVQTTVAHRARLADAVAPRPEKIVEAKETMSASVMRNDKAWQPAGGASVSASPVRERDEGIASTNDSSKAGKGVRVHIMLMLVACVAIAAVWRLIYLEEPSKPNLLISSGISMLVAGSAALLYLGLRKREHVITDMDDAQSEEAEDIAGARSIDPPAAGRRILPTEHPAEHPSTRWKLQPEEPNMAYTSVQEHAAGTWNSPPINPQLETSSTEGAHMAQDDATVLLGGRHSSVVANVPGAFYLHRTYQNKKSVVELAQSKLVIGRAADNAGYVDMEQGVSRAHLELVKKEGAVIAKDLGSRNGTFYNGQLMVPYKQYQLKSGDKLQLAGLDGPVYELQGDEAAIPIKQAKSTYNGQAVG
ncbi:DUF6382 domain-containing protein [Paenibacillus sp. SYP-B4298]|uniref:DUF6382 domain-containing protein n=1 Tax=Paenibacillus sp. SYP-B4298 TaxID=2996034 RepID=UPI0022DE3FDC|nr:DUF6382 domain-containing protein [Paenibacillus sp. SYP-B4298]